MPYDIFTDENGKLVLTERKKVLKNATEFNGRTERFLALESNNREYEVWDTEDEAAAYLRLMGGGRLYHLTYYRYKVTEVQHVSTFLKTVEGR